MNDDSSFNDPQTIRALYTAKEALKKSLKSKKVTIEADTPNNAGQPWKPEEDEELESRFDSGMGGVSKLEKLHGRTKGAISSRLVRLGKIEERSDVNIRNKS